MNEQSDPGAGPYVALRCRGCGAGLRARAWREGMACPRCRGKDVQPLPAPGGAVDYIVADRRQGTTAADVMFAEWAKWCGYVTANQCNAAVHRQNSELQSGQTARPIHEVMISLGSLDEKTADGLLRFLAVRRPDANDDDFAARLLRRGHVDSDAVEKVRTLQREMAGRRNEVPPVAQLLVQKRVISEAQMLELLQEQAKDGAGALKAALEMSRAPVKEKVVEKITRRVAASPLTPRNAAVVLGLVVLVAAVWAWRLRAPQVLAYGQCTACGAWVAIPWNPREWPAICPRCHIRAVLFAVKCPNGHVFLRSSPDGRELCPVCHSDFGRPLTQKDFERVLQEPAKARAGSQPVSSPAPLRP